MFEFFLPPQIAEEKRLLISVARSHAVFKLLTHEVFIRDSPVFTVRRLRLWPLNLISLKAAHLVKSYLWQ
jgi:hypothetical protein